MELVVTIGWKIKLPSKMLSWDSKQGPKKDCLSNCLLPVNCQQLFLCLDFLTELRTSDLYLKIPFSTDNGASPLGVSTGPWWKAACFDFWHAFFFKTWHDIFHPPPSRWWLPIWSICRWMRWRYYRAMAAATTTRPRSRRREKFRWLEVRCQPATVSSLRMEAAKWVEAATTQNSYYRDWQTVTWLYCCS